MYIHYSDRSTKEGLILSLAGPELRVAIRDENDPIVFRLVADSWTSEDGQIITLQFPLGIPQAREVLTAMHEVVVEGLPKPRACLSGGECFLKTLEGSNPLADA